ncbi:hypothetical protein [Streptomyces sp. NPDC020996]|uniref:HU family DNA-binding protein n=1 Tax=Streptomyces sp. NPDC020996 TaxID=3154791 RepID=UPI0033F58EE7
MDKARLIKTAAENLGRHDEDGGLSPEEIERVLDAVFGTVERPGAIAQALRSGQTVSVGSFGSFRSDDGTPVFRPGTALSEFLQGQVR